MSEESVKYNTSVDYVRNPITGERLHDTEGKPLFNVTLGIQGQEDKALDEHIRKIVQEELRRMVPEITEQVSARITRAIQMHGGSR